MFTPTLPQWHIDLLAGVYSVASTLEQRADAALLLNVIAAVRPGSPEISLAQSIELFRQHDFNGARHSLENAATSQPDNAMIKALLAWALFMQRDGLWEACVADALALAPDASTTRLVEALARAAGRSLESLHKATGHEGRADWHGSSAIGLAC